MSKTDASKIADLAELELELSTAGLIEDYYYQSLTLCVINAVYSINTRYKAVQNVVERYCEHFGVKRVREDWSVLPLVQDQEAISDLCNRYEEVDVETFAAEIYQNRQRTSPKNGILKAEAVRRFAATLSDHSIEYLQDIPKAMSNKGLERAIRSIPGQRSGISLSYFWMLAGSDDHIKPDRMITRFLNRAISREPSLEEAQGLLSQTTELLRPKFTHLTPRLLDYVIWQREQANLA